MAPDAPGHGCPTNDRQDAPRCPENPTTVHAILTTTRHHECHRWDAGPVDPMPPRFDRIDPAARRVHGWLHGRRSDRNRLFDRPSHPADRGEPRKHDPRLRKNSADLGLQQNRSADRTATPADWLIGLPSRRRHDDRAGRALDPNPTRWTEGRLIAGLRSAAGQGANLASVTGHLGSRLQNRSEKQET